MSKTKEQARGFLQKAATGNQFKEGFEISPPSNPPIAIPINLKLTEEEQRKIEKILVDDYRPGNITEMDVERHVKELKDITTQIKSISAQSVLLHGERIQRAQNILRDYREGAFTKWLMETYGNRQTPYSMLRYYEFYQSAPKDSRPLIESTPKKAVYLLASRDGDNNKKLEIIREHGRSPQGELILLINDIFPIADTDKRKKLPLNTSTIETISKECQKLEKRSQYLSDEDRKAIEELIKRLQKLCLDPQSN